ncbi:lactate utilization protein [Lachnospiraceae bacterium OttesenSCG-928-D06]|nr:lactate utilization protein [Lachnospiraceae bacterium OttesenSCG-928-D06]
MYEKEIALKERNKLLAKKIVKNLQSRNFDAYYFENKEDALHHALSLIPESSSVSWGGSITLSEIGLLDCVKEGKYTVIDRDSAKTPEERVELMRKALLCDTYLTSFNGMSEDGVLINIDGVGNRVAAISFGPKSIIGIVGMNKVCKTTASAIERARTYAAPVNMQRIAINPHFSAGNTPCSLNGSCADCKSADCICSYIVETRMCKVAGRIKIILVGEDLGI